MAILIRVSDRGRLKDVSQSPQSPFERRCKLLILKRRDVGVVDRARLESKSGDAHQVIQKHLFA